MSTIKNKLKGTTASAGVSDHEVIKTGKVPPKPGGRSQYDQVVEKLRALKPGTDQHYEITVTKFQTWRRHARTAGIGLASSGRDLPKGMLRVWRKS